MNKQKTFLQRFAVLPATALIALGGSWTSVCAQAQLPKQELSDVSRKLNKSTSDITSVLGKAEPLTRSVLNGNSYILGPGDSVMIELLDIPEYSGNFTIGPDGNLYLPRLRSIRVEGLTVDELQQTLTEKMRNMFTNLKYMLTHLHIDPSESMSVVKCLDLGITIFLEGRCLRIQAFLLLQTMVYRQHVPTLLVI